MLPEEIRRRVGAILEMVELPGKEDRYPHQLSGGEKQRVALARALVLEPAVLLLDEPLGALDQKLRQQMQVELKRLHARLGITFIFVTHDQEEALVMSDRVAVINHGRLEQVGSSEEIYERPRTHFVADFMGVENFFAVNCAAHTPDGTRFEMEGGQALWAANSADLPRHSLGDAGGAARVRALDALSPRRERRPAEFTGRRTGGVDLRGRKTSLGSACFHRPAGSGAGLERRARIAPRRRGKSLCLVGCDAELGLSA